MVALPASLSAWSFPFTSACPRQYVHRSLQVILQEKWDFIKRKVENIEEGGGKKKRVRSSFSLSEHWVLRLSVSCWFRCCCSVLGAVVLGVKAAVLCFHVVCFVVLSTGWLQHQVWGLHVREDHTQVHDWWNVVTWISGWTGSLQLQVWYPQLSPLLSFVFLSICFLPHSVYCLFSSSQSVLCVFLLTVFTICLLPHSHCHLSSSSQHLLFVFLLTAFTIRLLPHSLCHLSFSSQSLLCIFLLTVFTIYLLLHSLYHWSSFSHSFYHLFSASQSLLCLLPYSFWPFIFFLTGFTFCLFPHSFYYLPFFLTSFCCFSFHTAFTSCLLLTIFAFLTIVSICGLPRSCLFSPHIVSSEFTFCLCTAQPSIQFKLIKVQSWGCVWPTVLVVELSPVKVHFSVVDLSVLLQGWVNSVQFRCPQWKDTFLWLTCFTPRLSKFSADQVRCHQWYYTFLWPTCLFYSKAE